MRDTALPENFNVLGTVLLVLEFYHFISHGLVLYRVRLLPRKDLVRVRFYFLFDAATVLTVYFYTRQYWWQTVMTVFQFIQHMYYFIFWESSYRARKVVSWSSLDWLSCEKRREWQYFEVLGTLYDWLVHLINIFLLCPKVSSVELILSLALVHIMVSFVLFNPRLAWSSPMEVPQWIKKRIQPLDSNAQ